MRSFRIATWNIAGARKVRSQQSFDYKERDLNYFADQLRAVRPDVVCLQEGEYADRDDIVKKLAEKIDMSCVFQTQMHVSHIDPGYKISEAILSREPFESQRATRQPYPDFDLRLPNGAPAKRHIKYLQVVELRGLSIANVQTQPLEFLGTPYESERGRSYARQLSGFFVKKLKRPLVFAGDFCADLHTKHVFDIYREACDALELSDSLPPGQTKPNNSGRADAIFISPELRKVDSGIVKTQTDHYLCWAEVQYTE